MKRSELFNYLQRELSWVGTDYAAQAERILSHLEKIEMLPPARKLGYKEAEALRSWSLSDQIIGYHSWDKE